MIEALRPRLLILATAGFVLVGCGYGLVGRVSNIPEDIKNVYVETLKNETQRSQLEQILTEAIIEEMVTRRRFEIVNSAADADAVLRGSVKRFSLRPITFNNNGLVDNFEIEVSADMDFRRVPAAGQRPEDAEVVWRNSRYLFRSDYPVESGSDYLDRENIAIMETSGRFAQTLITDLLEGF